MQQIHGNKHFYLEYVDRLILFFTPSGGIIMKMGNRYVVAGAAEVRVETRRGACSSRIDP